MWPREQGHRNIDLFLVYFKDEFEFYIFDCKPNSNLTLNVQFLDFPKFDVYYFACFL